MARARKYPVELLQRATRLVFESGRPIAHVAADLGLPSETLRKYVRQVEANEGRRSDLLTSEEREEIRKLRRENFELRRANEILKAASAFIDEERGRFGVEPICQALDVSASAYYQRRSGERSARAVEDERLLELIREIHARNYFAYGSWRMWRALRRAGEEVGRGRVERLMRSNGIRGAKRRGKPWRTTKTDPQAQRRPDLVQGDFTASRPNALWVADLSYLRCWEDLLFFAFIIDCFSRMVVGWQLAAP